MSNYNSKSLKAEEFISDEEILDTLKFAEENKEDVESMKKVLQRARDCKGLTYREAAQLLECGHYSYYVSDGVDNFITFADRVLPCDVKMTSLVNIESY